MNVIERYLISPSGLILGAFALMVVVAVREAAGRVVNRVVAGLVDVLEATALSSRRVRRRSVRRYRRTVAERFAEVPIPFQLPVTIPMRSVYVPLRAVRAQGPRTAVSFDLASAVGDYGNALVVGPAGSGKSLFLRHRLWRSCVSAKSSDTDPLIVYIALGGLGTDASLFDAVVQALAAYGFASAERYVRRELSSDDSNLVVLFDGLDEVDTQQRSVVTRRIIDFVQTYRLRQVIVTTREAAYRGELDGVMNITLHVQEFTDELIERFMYAWPEMSSPEAVDRLLNALREIPRVAALVRNPLLLTMLTYLYSFEYGEKADMLPRSRASFYRQVTQFLLDRWHRELNTFEWVDKKLVLQRLALLIQGSVERRQIEYRRILAAIAASLPEFNVAADRAPEFLNELVERSGLLMKLDGGERYQFAHLSLQEYFAALELARQPEELSRLYLADRDAWREPLKLWCGGDGDSTDLIRMVVDHGDMGLALECLADATKVDKTIESDLLARARDAFPACDAKSPIVQAFGELVSDLTPRGQDTFEYLRVRSMSPITRVQAVTALALSNRSDAAEVVVALAAEDTSLLPIAERMGDVAVPSLAAAVEKGRPEVITSLTAIGTPKAALILAGWLWHHDEQLARTAAVELAQLSASAFVEDGLIRARVPDAQLRDLHRRGDWVWAPFTTDRVPVERDRLTRIFGRCLALLDLVTAADVERVRRTVDPRLAVAVFLFRPDGTTRAWPRTESLRVLSSPIPHRAIIRHTALDDLGIARHDAAQFRSELVRFTVEDSDTAAELEPRDLLRRLGRSDDDTDLTAPLAALAARSSPRRLLLRMLRAKRWPPRPSDWAQVGDNITQPHRGYYRFPYMLVLAIATLGAGAVTWHIAAAASIIEDLLWTAILFWLISGIVYSISTLVSGRSFVLRWWSHPSHASLLALLSPIGAARLVATVSETTGVVRSFGATEGYLKRRYLRAGLAYGALAGFTPAWIAGLVLMLGPFGWHVGVVVAAVGIAIGTVAGLVGRRTARKLANPIAGIFADLDDVAASESSPGAVMWLPHEVRAEEMERRRRRRIRQMRIGPLGKLQVRWYKYRRGLKM